MEIRKIRGEFESVDFAELAAGRIRRSIRGIQSIKVHPFGKQLPPRQGSMHFTMLPANMRMQNYATAVMISEMPGERFPEPEYSQNAELIVFCRAEAAPETAAMMQALGALKVQKR